MITVVNEGLWRKCFLVIALALISLFATVHAAGQMKNEPNGFVDLYWGESISAVQSTHPTQIIAESNGQVAMNVGIKEAGGNLYLRGPVVVQAVFKNDQLIFIMIPIQNNLGGLYN